MPLNFGVAWQVAEGAKQQQQRYQIEVHAHKIVSMFATGSLLAT